MSDIKSLVRVDRVLIANALENYDKKVAALEKEAEEGVQKYKDGYKFSWWDRVRGRDKWDSEKLFYFDRERNDYWTSMYSDLYACGLLSQEAMLTCQLRDTKSRDFLSSALYSGSEEFYLDDKCLRFIKSNT